MNKLPTSQTISPDEIIPPVCNDTQDDITAEDQKYDFSTMWKLRFKHNMSLQQIADKLGCHKSTVSRRLENHIKLLPNADEIRSYQEDKSQYLSGLELMTYNEMCNPQKLKDASFNNLAYGYNTLFNANRLESGKSTGNISVVEVTATIKDLQNQAAELLKQL